MFLEQQISILEWFPKNHLTLIDMEDFANTGINYILKYINNLENRYIDLNRYIEFPNIDVFTVFLSK